MTKQESIKYISSLVNNPASITEGDKSSIALFRQRFPYFVPMRYLLALEAHKKAAWSPDMLSTVQPYMGNWLLFCNFLEEGTGVARPSGATEHINTQFVAPDEYNVALPEEKIYNDPVLHEEIAAAGIVTEETIPEETTYYEPATTAVEQEVVPEAEPETETAIEEVQEPEFAETEASEETVPVVPDTITADEIAGDKEPLIEPIHTQDYFLHQGERVSEDIPEEIEDLKYGSADEEKSLMVMMSFSEWLLHFKNSAEKQKEEVKDRKALRTMWQKEKLAAAMEEENEEIPENVFEMAVNSITQEDGLVSETLAEVYVKQGKYDRAIELYRKLSLRNPQKNVYFARKIDEVLKDKQS